MSPPGYIQASVKPQVQRALRKLAERENTTVARLAGRLLEEAMLAQCRHRPLTGDVAPGQEGDET